MGSPRAELWPRPGARPGLWLLLALAIGISAGGCGIGSGAIRQSRLKYNKAFQDTEKQELLLNLVRLRYDDPIEMLPISSITTQFEFGGGASYTDVFGGRVNDALGLFDGLTLNGNLAERPTVAMSPRREQDFLRHTLLPMDIQTVSLLRGTGQPIAETLAMTVDMMAGLGVPPGDPRFLRALGLIHALSRRDAIYLTYDDRTKPKSEPVADLKLSASDLINATDRGYKFVSDPRTGMTTLQSEEKGLSLHFAPRADEMPEGAELRALLNLVPGREMYAIEQVSNMPPRTPFDPPTETISIRVRSLYDTLRHLSRAVQIPPTHVAKGYVRPLDDLPGCPLVDPSVREALIEIHEDVLPPTHASVAVKYRQHWFSIRDDDVQSKATFRYMYLLIAAEVSAQYEEGVDRPILTIPLGDVGD